MEKRNDIVLDELIDLLNQRDIRFIAEIYPSIPVEFKRNKKIAEIVENKLKSIEKLHLTEQELIKLEETDEISNTVIGTIFTKHPTEDLQKQIYTNIYSDINYYIGKMEYLDLSDNFVVDKEFFSSIPYIYIDEIIEYIRDTYKYPLSSAEIEVIKTSSFYNESYFKKYLTYLQKFINKEEMELDNKYIKLFDLSKKSPMVVDNIEDLPAYLEFAYSLNENERYTYISDKVCSINEQNAIIHNFNILFSNLICSKLGETDDELLLEHLVNSILCDISPLVLFNELIKKNPFIIDYIKNYKPDEKDERIVHAFNCMNYKIQIYEDMKTISELNNKIKENKIRLANEMMKS